MNNKNLPDYLTISQKVEEYSNFGPGRTIGDAYVDKYAIPYTSDYYLDNIYVKTGIEEFTYKTISRQAAGKMVTICGPAGCGKSSVCSYIARQFKDVSNCLVHLIDLRTPANMKRLDYTHDGGELLLRDVRSIVLENFKSRFDLSTIYEPSEEIISRLRFFISPEIEYKKARRGVGFVEINSLSVEVASLYNVYKRGKGSVVTTDKFEVWLKNAYSSQEIQAVIIKLGELLDLAHYVAYSRWANLYKNIIIMLDNIDAFDERTQQRFIGIVQDLHKPVLNTCTMVVSVREENIYRVGKFSDNFNEPFITQISFTDPAKSNRFTKYKAVNIPVVKIGKLKDIFSRKYSFCKLAMRSELIDGDGIQLSGEFDLFVKSEDMFVKFFPDKAFESYKNFVLEVLDALWKEDLIYLSNNSVKETIRIVNKFAGSLINRSESVVGEVISSTLYNQRLIATKFMQWIYTVDEPYGIELFNIFVDATPERLNRYPNAINCILPYIILTRIWNYNESNRRRPAPKNNPRLRYIVKEINSVFGFDKKDIKEAVYNLYSMEGGRGNFIVFRDKGAVESYKDLVLNSTVRITFRGMATLGYVMSSYGYVQECLKRLFGLKSREPEFAEMEDSLKKIIGTQVAAMRKVKDSYSNGSWLNEYLLNYGIPLDSTYVRGASNEKIGHEIRGSVHRRALFFEVLIESLGRYYPNGSKQSKRLEKLHNEFNYKIETLVNEG